MGLAKAFLKGLPLNEAFKKAGEYPMIHIP